MMTLMTSYTVAVYAAEQCRIFKWTKSDEIDRSFSEELVAVPDKERLECLQQSFPIDDLTVNSKAKVVVIVPDHWVSRSVHFLEHVVPVELLPLAALSYASETTFLSPGLLTLSHQQTLLEEGQAQLTVFACSSEWSALLCRPFQERGACCLLVTQQQWRHVSTSHRWLFWSRLQQHALVPYDPEKKRAHQTKKRWFIVLICSVMIHSMAYFSFLSMASVQGDVAADSQQRREWKAAWQADQASVMFPENVLKQVRALPAFARLENLHADSDSSKLQLLLPKQMLAPLLAQWRSTYPHWKIESTWAPYKQFTAVQGEEVIDVSISISAN